MRRLIRHLSLIIVHFLFFYTTQNLAAQQYFCKDNSETWLSVLFVGLITFHLSSYSKIKGKKNDY